MAVCGDDCGFTSVFDEIGQMNVTLSQAFSMLYTFPGLFTRILIGGAKIAEDEIQDMLARSTEGALREACADLGDYGKQVGKEVFSSFKKVEVPHNGYLLVGVFLLTFLLISSLGLNCYLEYLRRSQATKTIEAMNNVCNRMSTFSDDLANFRNQTPATPAEFAFNSLPTTNLSRDVSRAELFNTFSTFPSNSRDEIQMRAFFTPPESPNE